MNSDISYLEKPITDIEKGVAEVLEKITLAIRQKDLKTLASLYASNSKLSINSGSDNPMSREKFLEFLNPFLKSTRSIQYRDVVIREKSQNEALVFTTRIINTQNGIVTHEWRIRMRKLANRWFIIETGWLHTLAD